jgi:hypothetical protein
MKNRTNQGRYVVLVSLLLFFLVFGGFVYILMRPSKFEKARNEIETCANISQARMVFEKYRSDIKQDEDFDFALRAKLETLALSDSEIKECLTWLPPGKKSLNIIVVPDMSRRITDTFNNPHQIANDTTLFRTIWRCFETYSKTNMNNKDQLSIDVTDIEQANGQFGNIADSLRFDLSGFKDKSHRFYFTDSLRRCYYERIARLYAYASDNPLGADFRLYFRRYLRNRLKRSGLFDNYSNKLIIITDGYLEAESRRPDTKIDEYKQVLYRAVNDGNVLPSISKLHLNIPAEDVDLSDVDVLVCEVNERRSGSGYDYEILEAYWKDWLKRMGARRIEIIQRSPAMTITSETIVHFLNQ